MKNKREESLSSKVLREQDSDKICFECGSEMEKISIRKGKGYVKRYVKSVDLYKCKYCNFERRKRTEREILRDLGEIK